MDETTFHIQAAMGGERTSLEWVVSRFDPLLRAQVRYRLGRSPPRGVDVEDVVSEVWAIALPRISDLQARDGHLGRVLGKFLSTTSIFLVNEALRANLRRREHSAERGTGEEPGSGIGALAAETRGVVTRVSHDEVWRHVAEAIDELGEVRRNVLVLRLLEGRSNQEVATMLELKPNTASVHYKRGLEELRARLPSDLADEIGSLAGHGPQDEAGEDETD